VSFCGTSEDGDRTLRKIFRSLEDVVSVFPRGGGLAGSIAGFLEITDDHALDQNQDIEK